MAPRLFLKGIAIFSIVVVRAIEVQTRLAKLERCRAITINVPSQVIDQAIERIERGETLTGIAKSLGLSYGVLVNRLENAENGSRYARARKIGFNAMAESLLTLAHEIQDPIRARLKSDNIKWYLAKLNPERFGDKIDVSVSGSIDLRTEISKANDRLERQAIEIEGDYRVLPSDSKSDVHDEALAMLLE